MSVSVEKTPVPLGEPFSYRVLIVNRGSERARVLPIFFHSRDFLEIIPIGCGGEAEAAVLTADFESGLEREDYVVLGLDSFVGQEFLVTPEQPLEYLYGLTEGPCQLRAVLRLHSFSNRFSWEVLPPEETILESNTVLVTFGPPLEKTVARRRRQLHSSDLSEVSEALAYFSSVRAEGVQSELEGILGIPEGWTERFHDPVGAIWALRRNAGASGIEYFKAARTSRYRGLAQEALDDVRRNESP